MTDQQRLLEIKAEPKHWSHYRTYERDAQGRITRSYETEEQQRERVLARVNRSDACWSWTGHHNADGYTVVGIAGKLLKAHRVIYELLVGPIPDGMTIDHLCRNRGCVNPAHLEPVTRRENIVRGDTLPGRNLRKTHCPQGHPYDEENTEWYRGYRYCRACRKLRLRHG